MCLGLAKVNVGFFSDASARQTFQILHDRALHSG